MSMIGKTLAHYQITSQLGKGGMGEVYQANDTKLGRDVAIKVLPEEFARDADRVARFQREAKLLASLNHPNIAVIHGLEESNGTHFLVLELARISHKLSTAAAQRAMSTALRSLRLLDVLFKYACGVFSRAPCIHGPLHCLATKPCEKCGLGRPFLFYKYLRRDGLQAYNGSS